MSNAIATPEQVADKIAFTTFLSSWDMNHWKDFSKVDIRLQGTEPKAGDGFAVGEARIDLKCITKYGAQPVPVGTLFKVTIERVS